MSKITTCLCFETQAEEAANFYVRMFRGCGQPAALGAVTQSGSIAARSPLECPA